MECRKCGRYAEPDATTGYDADDLCPDCPEDDEPAEQPDPAALSELSIYTNLDTIRREGEQATDLDRRMELRYLLSRIESAVLTVTNDLARRLDGVPVR